MMQFSNEDLRRDLARYSARTAQRGLASGTGGNTSVRDDSTMWISPSGVALDEIGETEWAGLDIETGENLTQGLRPSSEYAMHLGIYRSRPDVNAIIHTHPTVTIAVISAGVDRIPFMFPDHVAVVGNLGCIDYVVPCSPQLADAVSSTISDTSLSGLLLRNHGLITLGGTVKEAYFRTEITEAAARIWWISQSVGTPRVLTEDECCEILGLEAEQYRRAVLRRADGRIT